jgi:hypothetical protein
VLWALAEAGCRVDPAHLDWLAAHAAACRRPGLYDGLAGIALALDRCGRPHDIRVDVDAVADDHSLFSGGPGIALAMLDDLDLAHRVADRGLAALDATPDVLPKAGLLHGWSGLALLLIRLAERTAAAAEPDGDRDALLDAAERALRADLDRCVAVPDGTLQVDEGWRVLPYVATGSAGIGLVLDQYLAHRPHSPLAVHREPIRRAASTEAVIHSGLFNGRAGLMLLLAGDETMQRHHAARLAWHAVPYAGHVAFAGDQLARLSMDLGTGAAGVLLALAAMSSERPVGLPFLPPTGAR